MASRKQSKTPLRSDDPGQYGEDFPSSARRYPGYAHDFASSQDGGQFSEQFKSWQKNRETPPGGSRNGGK